VTASSAGLRVRGAFFYPQESSSEVAKVSPGELIRQVRAETAQVVWPTRQETVATASMVLIMTSLLAFFFFGVDAGFSTMVRKLLSFLA
jgi:preprotein translocase subunit SecE